MKLSLITAKNPLAVIKKLKYLWNNELVVLLNSMQLSAGKGIRIQKLPSGTSISNIALNVTTANSANMNFITSFEVRYNAQNNILEVGSGYVNCNGIAETVEATAIDVREGLLSVVAYKSGTIWKFRIDYIEKFDEYCYPIAKITKSDNEIIIQQYPITVAIMLVSKICPLTKM